MIKQRFLFWITKKNIDKWVKNTNFFFILSIGRSGTNFFADLLNKTVDTYIVHEPVRSDHRAYQEAYHSEKKGLKYIATFRKKEIYLRARRKNIKTYGEVNSILRRHYLALLENFPEAQFFHLIRDGKDVVRSMMSRKTMTPEDRNTKMIYPLDGDPWKSLWPEMTRFQKCCWYWQKENDYLNAHIKNIVKFEDLLLDYKYFAENLLKPLNLEIPIEIWEKEKNLPRNITPNYKLPHWKEWDEELKSSFREICGKVMKYNGYSLP
jgi:hypothetical protein